MIKKIFITDNEFEIYKREKQRIEQENLFLILKNIREKYHSNKITKQDLAKLKDKYKLSEKHIKDYILTNPL